jgi:hypothetical protein
MDVADRQIFRGADFRRRQRGDRRKNNVPFLEERAEVARGGVKDRLLDCGSETSPTQLRRRMHNKLLAAARCIRATLFGKIADLQFPPLCVHILIRKSAPSHA